MARQDQMKALYEFFGGTPELITHLHHPYSHPSRPCVQGEPIEKMQQQMPMLYVTAPKSKEVREFAQVKFITYQLDAVLIWLTPGTKAQGADRGSSIMDDFYGLVDDIANQIRTNKTLITPSYPNGAAFKFGENFTIDEAHEIKGQMLAIVAHFQIESVEQVQA